MPFVKGGSKPPNSGRKKGSPAKLTPVTRLSDHVAAKLEELGCDPIATMAKLALDDTAEAGLRLRACSELAQYIYPKLRAVEHSGPGGGPIQHDIDPLDALTGELSRLAERQRATGDTQPVQPPSA